jgi:hypothetical protein
MKLSHIFRALGVLGLGAAGFLAASPAHATVVITNGGFEASSLAAAGSDWAMSTTAAPGWSTTVPDHLFEIWTSGFYGVSAYEGNQFIELNANQQGMVYQDVSGLAAGQLIDFSFAHRGRVTDEAMQFSITDLGADGLFGTADDSTLFSKIYTDGISGWGYYTSSGEAPVAANGDTLRFAFQSEVPGSLGNFLDGVNVSVSDIASTPEPGTWAAMAFLLVTVGGSSVYRRLRA